jgi:hypothetical protein
VTRQTTKTPDVATFFQKKNVKNVVIVIIINNTHKTVFLRHLFSIGSNETRDATRNLFYKLFGSSLLILSESLTSRGLGGAAFVLSNISQPS